MSRQFVERAPFFAIVAVTGLLLATGTSCRRHQQDGQKDPKLEGVDGEAAVFFDRPVVYCRSSPAIEPARVQLLIDASGSMVGFTGKVASIADWVEHAVSRLRGNALAIEEQRTCLFSSGLGLSCGEFGTTLAFKAASETNLHEAIGAASEYDLTFLVTDGVAAAGGKSGDCAGGVDAACAARALSDVVQQASDGSGREFRFGVWVLPLVTRYAGTFYTEEAIAASGFKGQDTMDRINLDIGATTEVNNPRVGSDGRLIFDYAGPRSLLLWVIARREELGREALIALDRERGGLGIQAIRELKSFQSSVASLPPIEVYPGYLPPARWKSLTEVDDPNLQAGTMDVSFRPGPPPRIELTCLQGKKGEGVFLLARQESEHGGANCLEIEQLAAANFEVLGETEDDKADLPTLLAGVGREGGTVVEPGLRLHLTCGTPAGRRCRERPITFRWAARMDYRATADGIANQKFPSPVFNLIAELSTDRPSFEPHRIYAFARMLEAFYQNVSGSLRRIPLAQGELCLGDGSGG